MTSRPRKTINRKKANPPSRVSLTSPSIETLVRACARVEAGLQALEKRLGSGVSLAEPSAASGQPAPSSKLGWLTAREFDLLAQQCHRVKIGGGEVLFAEGDEGQELYLLEEGLLEIYKKDFLGDLRIAEIKPGGMVGEMALIEGKPRSANVRAIQNSTVLALTRAKYEKFKEEHPAAATKLQDELLRMFSIRLRQTTEKMMGKI